MKVIIVTIPGVANPYVYSNRRKAIEACLMDTPLQSYVHISLEETPIAFTSANVDTLIHKLGDDEFLTIWSADSAEPIFELLLEEVR